jgi:hypothetical protein
MRGSDGAAFNCVATRFDTIRWVIDKTAWLVKFNSQGVRVPDCELAVGDSLGLVGVSRQIHTTHTQSNAPVMIATNRDSNLLRFFGALSIWQLESMAYAFDLWLSQLSYPVQRH